MLNFAPKTDEELNEELLWPKGNYGFKVIQAANEISKSGRNMIKIKLDVFNDNGQNQHVYDYLMAEPVNMMFKLRHACYACGLEEKYESGSLSAIDFEGCTGEIELVIREDKSGKYPPKNAVADYIVPEKTPANDELDDDIPFDRS